MVGTPTDVERRSDRERTARIAEQLAALGGMNCAELAARFAELTGQPAKSRNRTYLRKRVAWHLQAAEYGGVSDATLAKLDELIPLALARYESAAKRRAKSPAGDEPQRDRRLPEPGAVLRRPHGGQIHEVAIRERGFEYRGQIYRSLSAVARAITGTNWNGYSFFGCKSPGRDDGAKHDARNPRRRQ
jgi:hypothetical protein